jgi:leucyl aminopeptidase
MTSIRFSTRAPDSSKLTRVDCTIIPVPEALKLDRYGKALDSDCGGLLSAALKNGDFLGKLGQTLLLPGTASSKRLLLVGCGDNGGSREGLRRFCESMSKTLLSSTAGEACLHSDALKVGKRDRSWFFSTLARATVCASYRYGTTLSKPKPPASLKRFTVLCEDATGVRAALGRGRHCGEGINLARELANLPGNHCTPEDLAKTARSLARGNDKASCKVLSEKQMSDLGMGSLLSVTAGTATPAKLIVLEYNGGKRTEQPHVLVGKGITFDSGGISLKPGAKMDEMKFDMGGAASVLGTLQAVMAMKLPLNVVGIIAAAENMPSGTATKPGDVVTSMAGITIEVLNTDAEGRLVLCDALTYAERYKPASVVDIATLTGACIVALGSHASGLYANQDTLAEQLITAGEEAHDRAWRLPLWDDYQKQLDSNFADLANIGGPGAGSITAACFLSRFAKAYDWAHLDIAGAAWDSSPKGATGRPVGLLTQYLCDRADAS